MERVYFSLAASIDLRISYYDMFPYEIEEIILCKCKYNTFLVLKVRKHRELFILYGERSCY